MGPNKAARVAARPVPQEPMYILINLGLSENFGIIDYEGLAVSFRERSSTTRRRLRTDRFLSFFPSEPLACSSREFFLLLLLELPDCNTAQELIPPSSLSVRRPRSSLPILELEERRM